MATKNGNVPSAPPLFKKDFQTDTWDRLRARVEWEIEGLRAKLESDSDPIPTARMRARIAQLRELLAWETTPATSRRQSGFGHLPGETVVPTDDEPAGPQED